MLRIVHHQLFAAVREEPLYFGCLVDFDVPKQNFILDIPNLKLVNGVCDE